MAQPLQMQMRTNVIGQPMTSQLYSAAPQAYQQTFPQAYPAAAPAAAAKTGAGALGLSENELESAKNALGGQAGIDAIYAQLGGKDAVMKMIQSGQGLPAGFQLPAAIVNLGSKIKPNAGQNGGGYDYEYYDPDTGAVLPSAAASPLTQLASPQYPAVAPPSTTLYPQNTFSSSTPMNTFPKSSTITPNGITTLPTITQAQAQAQARQSFLPSNTFANSAPVSQRIYSSTPAASNSFSFTQQSSFTTPANPTFPSSTFSATSSPFPAASAAPQSDQSKANSIISAVGGQKTLDDVFSSLGGEAGIDAIYAQLGGKDAVMKMIQSGQGLPANFKLPKQLVDLGSKLQGAAKATKASSGGGYDYEYYYVDDNGKESGVAMSSFGTPVASSTSFGTPMTSFGTPMASSPFGTPISSPAFPTLSSSALGTPLGTSFSAAPIGTSLGAPLGTSFNAAPPGSTSLTRSSSFTAAPAPTPMAPLFAPPNPSMVSGGGSLFDFLENDDETSAPAKAPTPATTPETSSTTSSSTATAPKTKSLSERLAAAQNRVMG